jgi:Transmembrane amino acid transporter protein
MCKLVLRTAFVVLTTLISLMLPFFNAILGLVGSIAFWPLTVYYPVTMYFAQANIKTGEARWWGLQALNGGALVVSLLAAVGSVAGMAQRLKHLMYFLSSKSFPGSSIIWY